jgi:hypothetical protein
VATKQVNIDIIAKDKTRKAMQSATKGVDNLKGAVQQSVAHQQKSFSALGNTVKNVVGGVIVFQTLRFTKQMVDMASSVQEMQSKSSVVFGKFVSEVRNQLKEFGNSVGRSTFELEGMASSIQDTFVPMGFARGEASKLSVQLTKLAVDVASFNNASDTETMMAFQSALVGNHETVRRFGVVITEATLKQELLRMGITKNSKDVTNAEKVQARMNLIIAGTSDAHGDAIKTSGSFANTSKALGSALNELSVDVMTPMLPKLTKMVEGFIDATDSARGFFVAIGMLQRDLSTVAKREERIFEIEKQLSIMRDDLSSKLFGFNALEKTHIKNLEAELGHLKLMPELLLMQSDATVMATNAQKDKNEADAESVRILKEKQKQIQKEIENQALPMGRPVGLIAPSDGTAFGQDASMKALTKLDVLKNMAIQELALEQEIFENKYKVTQEQDELLAELRRINAEDTLTLAYETAEKEKAIRKKAFDDNFNLIKTGKAGEINLDKMSGKEKTDLAVKVGREALDQLAQNNKKAFALNKALKMADAIMSTAQGVSSALGTMNIPLAVAIGVMGAVQVATIMSQKYQGRKQGGRMNQGQPYLVGEAGPEVVVPDKASNVVPNGQLGGMGKQVNVNFNITTVDATGFSELLVNSRATIVNVINQALNEKGKEVLV